MHRRAGEGAPAPVLHTPAAVDRQVHLAQASVGVQQVGGARVVPNCTAASGTVGHRVRWRRVLCMCVSIFK